MKLSGLLFRSNFISVKRETGIEIFVISSPKPKILYPEKDQEGVFPIQIQEIHLFKILF
jgi:hypothetical protein